MQKWEYFSVSIVYREKTSDIILSKGGAIVNTEITEHDYLNSLGEQGWELVHVITDGHLSSGFYFKRLVE